MENNGDSAHDSHRGVNLTRDAQPDPERLVGGEKWVSTETGNRKGG